MITAENDVDLRKNIFETFAKEGITIFEMKKADATLEDAFMQLIDTEKEEIKNIEETSKEEVLEENRNKEIATKENEDEEGGKE